MATANHLAYSPMVSTPKVLLLLESFKPKFDEANKSVTSIENEKFWGSASYVDETIVDTETPCCCTINILTLFPVTDSNTIVNLPVPFRILLTKDQIAKTYSFTELVYRPPIV